MRAYEKTSLQQHEIVSKIISSTESNASYSKEFEKFTDGGTCSDIGQAQSMVQSSGQNSHTSLTSEKSLSSLFNCSGSGTFNFCPRGDVIINVTPTVTAASVKEQVDYIMHHRNPLCD